MILDNIDIERVADQNEDASRIEAAFNNEAIEAVRSRVAPETHPDFDGAHCVDCGDTIPFARLAHGRVHCVPCQTLIEQHDKLYAGAPRSRVA